MRRHMRLSATENGDRVDHPVAAANRPLRTEAPVIHDERCTRLATQDLDLIGEAETAALLAGAARPLAQGIMTVEHGIGLLHHLDRRRLRNADGRAAIAQPVMPG